MKINRSFRFLILAMLTVSSANSAPPPGLPTKATQLIRQTNALRGKAVNATPANAAQVLNNLTDFANNLKRNINSWLPGKSAAGLRNNVLTNLKAVLDPSIPQLKKKIKQAAKPTAPSAPPEPPKGRVVKRWKKKVPSAPPESPVTAPPAPILPSAPPEQMTPIGMHDQIVKGTADAPELVDFPGIADQAERFYVPLALEVVKAEMKPGRALAREIGKNPMVLVVEKLLVPYSLKSFNHQASVKTEDQAALRAKALIDIVGPNSKQFVRGLQLNKNKVPAQGEFSDTAQKALVQWIKQVEQSNPDLAKQIFKEAIIATDKALASAKPAERATGILLLARLIDQSLKDRPIMSLVEGLELE